MSKFPPNEEGILRINIKTPSSKLYPVEVYPNSKLKDLITDFYVFKGWKLSNLPIKVLLHDPSDPEKSKSLDFESTLAELGIKTEDTLLFIIEKDKDQGSEIVAEIVSKGKLHLQVPFPQRLPIEEYVSDSKNLLQSMDFIYSLLSILFTHNSQTVNQLEIMLSSMSSESLTISSLSPLLIRQGGEPLRIITMRYGSPFEIDLAGLWQPLEFTREVVKDLVWRGKHERAMANLEREKLQIEIFRQKIELVEKISNMNLGIDLKKRLIQSAHPYIESLDNVLLDNIYTDSSDFSRQTPYVGYTTTTIHQQPFINTSKNSGVPSTPPVSSKEEELFRELFVKVGRDAELVEHLIEYERKKSPHSDRVELLQRAIDRWIKNN